MASSESNYDFSKMNNEWLLQVISSGTLSDKEATLAAQEVEKRYPTPKEK